MASGVNKNVILMELSFIDFAFGKMRKREGQLDLGIKKNKNLDIDLFVNQSFLNSVYLGNGNMKKKLVKQLRFSQWRVQTYMYLNCIPHCLTVIGLTFHRQH